MAKTNSLLKKERQVYILYRLNLHNKILSANLCEDIGVSKDPVRRDLQELANAGKLTIYFQGHKQLRATFITGGLPALNTYLAHHNIQCNRFGDRVNKDSKIAVGASTIERTRGKNPDYIDF